MWRFPSGIIRLFTFRQQTVKLSRRSRLILLIQTLFYWITLQFVSKSLVKVSKVETMVQKRGSCNEMKPARRYFANINLHLALNGDFWEDLLLYRFRKTKNAWTFRSDINICTLRIYYTVCNLSYYSGER